jgi:hypothetical protein
MVTASCLEVRPSAEVGDQHDCEYDASNERTED